MTQTAVFYSDFNVFGPNEYHKGDMSSVVFKAFHQVQSTGKVQLFELRNLVEPPTEHA